VLDQDLICSLANYFPDYTIVLVGPKYTDISKLEKISNIIILGSKSHDQIPYYIKEFDVALIPYICNKFTDGVYPSKLFEYISMGKPVVSTKIREVDYISNIQKDIVVVSKGEHDFINSVESEIYNDKQSLKDMRIKVAVNNSWDLRFKEIKKIIDKHLNIELKSHANVSWKNKFSLYIQKKNRYRNLLIIVFLVIVMKLYSPLFWLIGEQLIVSDSIEKSDAIVVFSGDGEASYQNLSYQERALNAINIYKDGYADKIFLSSGREQTIADVEIIKLYLTSKNVSETSIYILDKYPNSTYQNVNLVKEKLVKNNVSSIIFVTSPYHSLRSVLTWKKNAPNIRINTPRMTNKLKNDAMWDTDLKKIRVIMYEYAAIVHNWFTGRI